MLVCGEHGCAVLSRKCGLEDKGLNRPKAFRQVQPGGADSAQRVGEMMGIVGVYCFKLAGGRKLLVIDIVRI